MTLVVIVDRVGVDRIEPVRKTDKVQKGFRAKAPQIVLMGNSICQTAFDPARIESHLATAGQDKRVYRYSISASGMGVWYLALKNEICRADPLPETVVISARTRIFLQNYYGFAAKHRRQFLPVYGDRFDDPVILSKIMSKGDVPLSMERLLSPVSNVYYNRQVYQDATREAAMRVSTDVMIAVARITDNASLHEDIRAVHEAVADGQGLAGLLRSRYNNPGNENNFLEDFGPDKEAFTWRNTDELSGAELVESSLLPDMIRLCEENGIQCIVARHVPNPGQPADALKIEAEMWRAVKAYIAEHHPGTISLDLKPCPGIDPSHFVRGDHFNREGRTRLSDYLAELLSNRLGGRDSRMAESDHSTGGAGEAVAGPTNE